MQTYNNIQLEFKLLLLLLLLLFLFLEVVVPSLWPVIGDLASFVLLGPCLGKVRDNPFNKGLFFHGLLPLLQWQDTHRDPPSAGYTTNSDADTAASRNRLSTASRACYFHILPSTQALIRDNRPLSSGAAPPLVLLLGFSQAAHSRPHTRPFDSMSLAKEADDEVEAPALRRNHMGYYVDYLFY